MKTSSNLKPVLRHRELLEEHARMALAEALEREGALLQRHQEQTARLDALQRELEDLQRRGISVQDLLLYEQSLRHGRREFEELAREIAAQEERTCACRKELTRACQEKKLIEKLRDRRDENEEKMMRRREMNNLDEMALQFKKDRL